MEEVYLGKALESLAGAESEFANGRYNNCANRCYYAVFQGAIGALIRENVGARGGQWGHAFVQAAFVGQLVNRRKLYPASLRTTLADNLILRQRADYEAREVMDVQAVRALRRTREFVRAVAAQGGASR